MTPWRPVADHCNMGYRLPCMQRQNEYFTSRTDELYRDAIQCGVESFSIVGTPSCEDCRIQRSRENTV